MPTADDVETAILRRLTPTAKVAVMHALWRQAWELKAAGLRRQHPTWTADQIAERVREIFLRAGP